MNQTYLQILATGGTIAGLAGSAIRHDYQPGQVSVATLIDSVRELGVTCELRGLQLTNIGSEDMDLKVWHKLHELVTAAFLDDRCAGVIITHGTDTAEETAFLLDQTLPTTKPVVIVGAMRPADAVGSDGLRNFANAIGVASDPDSSGRGVLVVMGDDVFAARDVRKARTSGVEAFRGYPRGAIARVTPSALEWFGAPWRKDEEARFAFPRELPLVPVLYALAGMSGGEVDYTLERKPDGLVIAGFGEGTMPSEVAAKLADAARSGLPVVRASRVDEGLVECLPSDASNNFIAARALNPQKARLLLQLLIASGISDRETCQAAFDRR